MERKQPVDYVDESTVTFSSGNIFADLELPNADERLAKAKLASTISEIVQARGLTQKKAAEMMGIDQPKVSKIMRGRLQDFSAEWLLSRILRLGLDINISIDTKSEPKTTGTIRVANL